LEAAPQLMNELRKSGLFTKWSLIKNEIMLFAGK
jgi:hypothetical protein